MRQPLFNIHRVNGPYRRAWNELRAWGPVASSRWDPHEEPASTQPDRAVLYAATTFTTSVSEVFQDRRAIPRDPGYSVASWEPTRTLDVLDLTAGWPVRNGASASLHAAAKSTCRAWSRAICTMWPDLDGLLVASTMTGKPNVVLYPPSADAFPAAPALSRRLNDRALAPLLLLASRELGWGIREP